MSAPQPGKPAPALATTVPGAWIARADLAELVRLELPGKVERTGGSPARLSRGACLLWITLRTYCDGRTKYEDTGGGWEISQDELALLHGVDVRTIRTWQDDLVAVGVLSVKRAWRKDHTGRVLRAWNRYIPRSPFDARCTGSADPVGAERAGSDDPERGAEADPLIRLVPGSEDPIGPPESDRAIRLIPGHVDPVPENDGSSDPGPNSLAETAIGSNHPDGIGAPDPSGMTAWAMLWLEKELDRVTVETGPIPLTDAEVERLWSGLDEGDRKRRIASYHQVGLEIAKYQRLMGRAADEAATKSAICDAKGEFAKERARAPTELDVAAVRSERLDQVIRRERDVLNLALRAGTQAYLVTVFDHREGRVHGPQAKALIDALVAAAAELRRRVPTQLR